MCEKMLWPVFSIEIMDIYAMSFLEMYQAEHFESEK